MSARTRTILIAGLSVCIVGAMLIGALPLIPYEGDGIGIANGIHDSLHEVFTNISPVAYNYDVQCGVNVIVKLVALATGGDVWTVFSLMTIAAAMVFVLFSVRAATALFGKESALPALAACILFPEAIVSAYYPNSLIFAAAFLALGLYLYVDGRSHWILPAIALGCAFWMRVDVVLAFPAFVFLRRDAKAVRPFWIMALMFGVSGIVGLGLLTLSDVSVLRLLHSSGAHLQGSVEESQGLPMGLGSRAFRTLLAFFPVLTVLVLVLGVVTLVRTRRIPLVLAGLLPLVIMLLVQRANLTTPKYLVYSIPFLMLCVIPALVHVTPGWFRSHRVLSVLLVLLSLQVVLGVRLLFRGKEYIEAPGSLQRASITLVPLGVKEMPGRAIERVELVVGGGSKINTDDENRLTSGLVYTPWCWREEKVMVVENVAKLRALVREDRRDTLRVVASSFCNSARQLMRWVMREEGFTYGTAYGALGPGVECYVNGSRTVVLQQIVYERDGPSSYIGAVGELPPGEVVFVSNIPWEVSFVASLPAHYPRIGDLGFRIADRGDTHPLQ